MESSKISRREALERYAGRYRDPRYGDVVVELKGGALALDFIPTPILKGMLEPFGADAFRTRFPADAEEAVVSFAVKDGAVSGIAMRALSPLADFSHDYTDMAFVPAGNHGVDRPE